MRIVVNDIAASSGGALSVLKSFYNYLIETESTKENEWIFLLGNKYVKETDNIKVLVLDKVKKNWLNRLKFDLFVGKKYISPLKPDVVFSLQNTITFGLECPQVVYMHQSIPFQVVKRFSFFKHEERKLAIYQYIIGHFIKKSIQKANKVIVQTNWIKDAVIKFTNVDPQNILTNFPDCGSYLKYKKDNIFDKHKFFYPAAKSVYKNHQCIYDACDILEQKRITNYNISLTIEDKTHIHNITSLGELSLATVHENYNTSTLIFPSYIETVGLPMLEARQMGTIILASDCPFSREVLDGYVNAYYFNPFKPHELADLIEKVLNGKIIKEKVDEIFNKNINSWECICELLFKTGGIKN